MRLSFKFRLGWVWAGHLWSWLKRHTHYWPAVNMLNRPSQHPSLPELLWNWLDSLGCSKKVLQNSYWKPFFLCFGYFPFGPWTQRFLIHSNTFESQKLPTLSGSHHLQQQCLLSVWLWAGDAVGDTKEQWDRLSCLQELTLQLGTYDMHVDRGHLEKLPL